MNWLLGKLKAYRRWLGVCVSCGNNTWNLSHGDAFCNLCGANYRTGGLDE